MTLFKQDFGWALDQLEDGYKVRRRNWNGKGMWIAIQRPDAYSKMSLPYIYMQTAQGDLVPWLASQSDLLTWDWELVEGQEIIFPKTSDVPVGTYDTLGLGGQVGATAVKPTEATQEVDKDKVKVVELRGEEAKDFIKTFMKEMDLGTFLSRF